MIYEVLGKLLGCGATYAVLDRPIKYAPVSARELIERLKSEAAQTLGYLEEALRFVERSQEVDTVKRTYGQ